jgi:hypothetical protein
LGCEDVVASARLLKIGRQGVGGRVPPDWPTKQTSNCAPHYLNAFRTLIFIHPRSVLPSRPFEGYFTARKCRPQERSRCGVTCALQLFSAGAGYGVRTPDSSTASDFDDDLRGERRQIVLAPGLRMASAAGQRYGWRFDNTTVLINTPVCFAAMVAATLPASKRNIRVAALTNHHPCQDHN